MFIIFDRILPSEFGVREPLFTTPKSNGIECDNLMQNCDSPSIKVQNLTKKFGDITALNDFSVNINQNQI